MSMAGLLVAMCAINVATLLLLRAAARAREMSMRYALGASRPRIISQLFVEGGLLGLAGAFAGLAFAPLVANALVRLMTQADPGSEPYSAVIDSRVLLFTLGISVVVSLLFSLAPVLHFIRPNLVEALRQSAGTASRGSQRFRKAAVGVQIALSVLLLGAAGLFVHTLDNLRHQPVGFDTSRLATFSLDPTNSGYGEDRTPQIITSAVDSLNRIPGVISAAATTDPELTGDSETHSYAIEGYTFTEDESKNIESPDITPGYFATIRQPVLVGREFTAADAKAPPGSQSSTLLSRSDSSARPKRHRPSRHRRRHAPALNPTQLSSESSATRVTPTSAPNSAPPSTVPTHNGSTPSAYSSTSAPRSRQRKSKPLSERLFTTSTPLSSSTASAPWKPRPSLPPLANELSPSSPSASPSSLWLLAAVGLYGVLAYSTEQRTREIGVRLALGAPRSSIVIAVLREMALIAAIATVIALPLIGILARGFRSQLYGVTVYDPITLAASTALIVLVVLLAAALPARRAAGVEPMQALRPNNRNRPLVLIRRLLWLGITYFDPSSTENPLLFVCDL